MVETVREIFVIGMISSLHVLFEGYKICNKAKVLTPEQIHIMPVAICLRIFCAHTSILSIIKVKNLVLIKWSCRSPHHVDI